MLLLLAQRLLKRQGTVYPIHPLWPPRKPAPKGDSVMQTRRLGNTDLQFSRIGLGTWALGGGDWTFSWGAQDDAQSVETVCRALDLGVNWIDTAPVYGLGHSEEVVGKAIKGMSVKPLIATKCERCWDKDRKIYPCLKRESIRAEAEASLRRLGTDVIDLYQIHWPQPDADLEEGWATVAELVREGKVRYAGVSNFSLAQLQRIEPIHPVASLQPPYSMITRGVEAELLPYCHDHHIGVIVYSPMQKGLLTGKVTPQWVAQLPANDHRRNDPQFQPPRLAANIELAEGLRRLAEVHGRTASQAAVAWVLRRPEVTAAIVGARKPSQIEETIPAAGWQLSPKDLAVVDGLLERRRCVG